jgi:Flp pilus assembly protein TadG
MIRGLARDGTGASAVETAIVLTIFLALLFGIVKFGLVLWTQGSLHYAVKAAARCAAIKAPDCADAAATKIYAMTRYFGQVDNDQPTFVPSKEACGQKVTAAYNYPLSIPFWGEQAINLSAQACYP